MNKRQWALIVLAALLAGCTQTPQPQGPFTTDQQKALNDPMHYSPNMDNTDITGGDIGNYDSKAMQRDVNDFWNP